MRETLVRLLTPQFGPLPESITRRIEHIGSDDLDGYLDRGLVAESSQDVSSMRESFR